MIKKIILFTLLSVSIFQNSIAQTSPWGVGLINNQSLNPINGQSIYTSHTYDIVPVNFDLNDHLSNYTYNIYIPNDYDGTEPYGLITFINSSNSGLIINSWIPVLEEKNIIMISGNNIGNSVAVNTRMGVALAGSEKLKEILNIDTSRIYGSGNSGGARSCAEMLFFFPEKFQGMVPNCGSGYMRMVDQDYETYQLNSHYEYSLYPYTPVHLAYVESFDRKYAMMTSFDDFREGDIMNIYHNGMEPDGFKSKILETAGTHCSTSTEHFRDAINFVEHPHLDVIRDSFDLVPEIGNGFKTTATSRVNNQLNFNLTISNLARAYSNDPFLWNDEKGAIFRTSIELDSLSFNENSFFNIGLLDFTDPSIYNQEIGHELYPMIPNILVSVHFDNLQPTVHVLSESPSSGISNDTLFSGTMSDWSLNEPLGIKYHIWDQELRIEFGKHFNPNVQVDPMAKLLDDNRSIRIRTNGNYWNTSEFNQGSLLTFVAGKLDTLLSSSNILVNFVEVIAADTTDNISVSIIERNSGHDLLVYPNPSDGKFSVDLGTEYNSVRVTMMSVNGKLIQACNYNDCQLLKLNIEEPPGVYILTIESENKKSVIRLVKK